MLAMSTLYDSALSLLTDPKHTRWLAPLLIVSEAALCFLIILYVPYTEIDYSTYMAQVHQYLQHGERNYANIKGPTGPLVYPAMHVWIYSALYYLTAGRSPAGELTEIDVPQAQIVFGGLYLVTLAIVIACYRRVGAPPWLLIPLVLSKRLHSIFLLRLFNDAWATLFFWLTIYAMQRKYWHLAAMTWSVGVGVKMTVLLAGPAVAVLLIQAMEMSDAAYMGIVAMGIQIVSATPFMEAAKGGDIFSYVARAFNFGRAFLFKWTVNWRFVGEQTFLSKEFAGGLLVLHLSLLVTFIHTKWVRFSSSGIGSFVRKFTRAVPEEETVRISKLLTPVVVMDTMLGSMIVGVLCARSLHYQFLAYIGWASPYLLWRGTGSMVLTLAVCAVQELSWLVFPSTDLSSAMVVGCLMLQVVCAFIAQPADGVAPPEAAVRKLEQRAKEAHADKPAS